METLGPPQCRLIRSATINNHQPRFLEISILARRDKGRYNPISSNISPLRLPLLRSEFVPPNLNMA